MLRYLLPTLLLLAFLTLPQATELDSWQREGPSSRYHSWQYQRPNRAFPSLRTAAAKVDKAALDQPFWSFFGQPRNRSYLRTTTPAQRVDFAVAYWHFLDKQVGFDENDSKYHSIVSEYGLCQYRSFEIPYKKCRDFAVSWWAKNTTADDKKHYIVTGQIQDLPERWLQESLLDAGELLYRVHVAGVPTVLCDDSPLFTEPHKYLPFLESGFFIHQQFAIDRGFDESNLVQELKERTILTAESVLARAQQTADSMKNSDGGDNVDQAATEKKSLTYSLVNHKGQIALSVSAPAVANFHHGVARIGLRLAAPIGGRETSQRGLIARNWDDRIGAHQSSVQTTHYEVSAVVDVAGNWHYDVVDYIANDSSADTDISLVDSTQSYNYNQRAESNEVIYPSDSTINPKLYENGYYGYEELNLPAIPARFDWAGSFHQGLALVLKDGKFGFINNMGNFVIPPTFEAAGSFSEGLAPALDPVSHRWGYIARSGNFVIAPRFLAAYPFLAGLAVVSVAPSETLPAASPLSQSSLDLVYGRAALDNKQCELARSFLQKAVLDDPHGAFAKQAQVYLKTRIPARIIPFDSEVDLRIANLDYSGGKLPLLKKCIQACPNFEWAYADLAQTYIDSGNFSEATSVLEQLQKINPNFVPGHLLMSDVGERNGHDRLAKQELQAAKALSANDDLVRAALASHGL